MPRTTRKPPTRKPKIPAGYKPKNCKCSMRDGVHEVTCQAFDVDAEIDRDVKAPDTQYVIRYENGQAVARNAIDDDDEADDDLDDTDDDADAARYEAVVDGQPAIIDATQPPELIAARPTHDELMNALTAARHALDRKTLALKTAKDAAKLAQMSVDALVAQLAQAWEDRNQLELPLADTVVDAEFFACASEQPRVTPCASCHNRDGTIPLANGALWCTACVQTALAEPHADTPLDAQVPALETVITALSEAMYFDGLPDTAKVVAALATDTRDVGEIRRELAHLAGQHEYLIRLTPPFVTRLAAVPA